MKSKIDFVVFFKNADDKTFPIHKKFGADIIEIPTKLLGNEQVRKSFFGDINKSMLYSRITDTEILVLKN